MALPGAAVIVAASIHGLPRRGLKAPPKDGRAMAAPWQHAAGSRPWAGVGLSRALVPSRPARGAPRSPGTTVCTATYTVMGKRTTASDHVSVSRFETSRSLSSFSRSIGLAGLCLNVAGLVADGEGPGPAPPAWVRLGMACWASG